MSPSSTSNMIQNVMQGAHHHNLHLVYHKLEHFISTLLAMTWVRLA